MRFNISVSFDSLSQKPAFDTEAIEAAYLLLAGRESVWALIEPSSEAGVSALPAIAAQLQQLGVTSDRMIILFEPVLRSEGGGDIQVTLDRYRATTTGCHGWSRPNLLNNPTLPSGNFGCASAQNLAGMIADPRDLVAPRKLAPADAYREAGAVGNYREGELPEFVELDTSTTD